MKSSAIGSPVCRYVPSQKFGWWFVAGSWAVGAAGIGMVPAPALTTVNRLVSVGIAFDKAPELAPADTPAAGVNCVEMLTGPPVVASRKFHPVRLPMLVAYTRS